MQFPEMAQIQSSRCPVTTEGTFLFSMEGLITGIIICVPKLLSRPGSDKPGYRTAAAWLNENTTPDDLIATPDRRITFYAERKELIYETALSSKADYIVAIVKNENEVPDFVSNAQKQYSVWENESRKKKKIVIYKTPL